MANNLDSNTTKKVARVFLQEFEKMRVATKTVNTNLLTPEFTPQFGDEIAFKRPHQYRSIETSDGNISSSTKNTITSGKAIATVQNYITVPIDWTNREEALELDQLEEIIRPAAQECVTRFETNFQNYMIQNAGLHSGTTGSGIKKWSDVANMGALMTSIGVPTGMNYALLNPFSTTDLADTQSGLASGDNRLVTTAWEKAQISRNFGGLQALMSNSMSNFQSGDSVARTGTISATPDATYLTAKDTYQQTVTLTGLTASTANAVRAGDTLVVTEANRSRLHLMTRQVAFDNNGSGLNWTYKVVTGGDTDGSGDVTVTVTGAAISETDGQYNNIENPITAGDAFTLSGTTGTVYQPSLFYNKEAFGVGTIKLPKLHTWDTVATTSDGVSIRCTKYSDGDANSQSIRFDLLPAHSTFNPLFAGTGWGTP
jgi:hypothetical protein